MGDPVPEPWSTLLTFSLALVGALIAVLIISAVASVIVRTTSRHRQWAITLITRARWPFRVTLLIVGVRIAVAISFPGAGWREVVYRALLIALISSGAWLVCQLLLFIADLSLSRYRLDVPDNRVARRLHTQLQIVRRLVVVIVVIIAIGASLLTFDGVRAVGASVLASAGIASIVAGLAAQSVLANVFAGVQLAFSEAIRVDDVVVVDGQWGRIHEITLTYVVVMTWDQRTVVLPCNYFTSTAFENWTKYGSEIVGAVELDVDWRVSTDAMRARLEAVLAESSLWDGRTQVLQVTDATGGMVRVRVLVSAADSAALWDLRCVVRESLVEWVRDEDAASLPLQRVLIGDPGQQGSSAMKTAEPAEARDRAGLFSGNADGEARASEFTAAIPVQEDARQSREHPLLEPARDDD
ncbi:MULTISPECIES: mechanosensitive ion channel family protein [Bacteria]